MIGKNFKKYWEAGFLFVIVSSLVYGLVRIYGNWVASVPTHEWRMKWLGITVTNPVELKWTLTIIITAVALLLIIPWLYGRLIEWLYGKFLAKKEDTSPRARK